ncbi:MAG: hypothetical protein KGL73_04155 [Burkholderiales bacterium]|nr:hypothetical protein [Burkholderiales bacterium]
MKPYAYPHSVLLLAGALLLGGCAAVNDATMRVLATPSPAWAVVGDKLLTGQALIYTDRSGTLELQTAADPALSCMGTMRYTATRSGTVNLRCNNGLQAQLPFTALGEASGYGGATGGPVSFAYGLEPGPARAWLTPPAGKRLVVSDKSLRLE